MLRTPVIALALGLTLAGCGGGGGGGGGSGQGATSPATQPVTIFYASGRIEAEGYHLAGTTTRTGHWRIRFDDPSGQVQWEGDYADGVIDASKPWREWNADGSIRVDSTDR